MLIQLFPAKASQFVTEKVSNDANAQKKSKKNKNLPNNARPRNFKLIWAPIYNRRAGTTYIYIPIQVWLAALAQLGAAMIKVRFGRVSSLCYVILLTRIQ